MTDDDEEEALIAGMVEELANRPLLELRLTGVAAVQLAGLLQLVLRHPGLDGTNRRTAVMVLEQIRAYVADAPATSEVMRRGDARP